ncbi:MAG: FAD-dependent oxidoreductase [Deltaproteobacteria bacterium]|nr:FAD-dependent oxidoreductase [Deltaproteobacteria bacterium]
MPDRSVDALIVGGGAAGAACAEALHEGGFGGAVLLVGREPDPPYERPPASKGYLAGTQDRDACLFHDAAWYSQRSIELASRTSVMRLDTAARTATLSNKEVVGFGVALIATGANVRRLRVEGGQLQGVHYLRALGNADAIRADAREAERVVVVGGSYIACEVAATLTALGRHCTMVMLEDAPLSTHFGATAGEFFGALLREHGVELVTGDGLERLEGGSDTSSSDTGRVERVVCASGRELAADMVVMGTGAMPDVMLARAAGLELGESGGVACAADLETSVRGIWAAGDMCEYDSVLHGGRVRIEHHEVARAQGAAVAAAMLGARRPYSELPYFWSDLSDWCTAEWVGITETPEREVVRGSVQDGAFSVLQLAGGRLVAALSVGRDEDLAHARRLISARTDLSDHAAELAGGDLDAL